MLCPCDKANRFTGLGKCAGIHGPCQFLRALFKDRSARAARGGETQVLRGLICDVENKPIVDFVVIYNHLDLVQGLQRHVKLAKDEPRSHILLILDPSLVEILPKYVRSHDDREPASRKVHVIAQLLQVLDLGMCKEPIGNLLMPMGEALNLNFSHGFRGGRLLL